MTDTPRRTVADWLQGIYDEAMSNPPLHIGSIDSHRDVRFSRAELVEMAAALRDEPRPQVLQQPNGEQMIRLRCGCAWVASPHRLDAVTRCQKAEPEPSEDTP